MIQNEIPKSNVKLHPCRVQFVYPSGMIDAKSDRDGSFFEQVNVIFGAAEGLMEEGQRCLIASDGAQHFVVGQMREPYLDQSNSTTVIDAGNELADLRDSKSIAVSDDFGNEAKVIVSKGGGLVLDGGGICVSHYNPGKDQISNYCDQYEMINASATCQMTNDGVSATTKYKFRTLVDGADINRDYAHEEGNSLSDQVTIEISPGSDIVTFKTRGPLEEKSEITIGKNGKITITTKSLTQPNPTVEIDPSKPNVSITVPAGITGTGSIIQANPDGVYIGDGTGSFNLKGQLDTLLTTINASLTATILGPQPLVPANAIALTIKNLGLRLALTGNKR